VRAGWAPKGVKVMVAGRLGGAEMSRTEWEKDGRIRLQTLKGRIDYGFAEANTTFGKIGVKAWVFRARSCRSEGRSDPPEACPSTRPPDGGVCDVLMPRG